MSAIPSCCRPWSWGELSPARPLGPGPASCRVDNLLIQRSLCFETSNTLCLLDGRVQAEARWRLPDGRFGQGQARPSSNSDRTGAFWFFNENNTELLVKALDGSSINGNLWFFYGALSDIEY